MKRNWDTLHKKAGYHEQEWLPVSKDDPIIGTYQGVNGKMEVTYLAKGITGPEFQIEWEDGRKVTVLDSLVVCAYLEQDNAAGV